MLCYNMLPYDLDEVSRLVASKQDLNAHDSRKLHHLALIARFGVASFNIENEPSMYRTSILPCL
jgi:hypothetical protein